MKRKLIPVLILTLVFSACATFHRAPVTLAGLLANFGVSVQKLSQDASERNILNTLKAARDVYNFVDWQENPELVRIGIKIHGAIDAGYTALEAYKLGHDVGNLSELLAKIKEIEEDLKEIRS